MAIAESDYWDTLLTEHPQAGQALEHLLAAKKEGQLADLIARWQRQLEVYHAELLVRFDRLLQETPNHLATLRRELEQLDTAALSKQLDSIEAKHAQLMECYEEEGVLEEIRAHERAELEKRQREQEAKQTEWQQLTSQMEAALVKRELDEAEQALRRLEPLAPMNENWLGQLEGLRARLIDLIKSS